MANRTVEMWIEHLHGLQKRKKCFQYQTHVLLPTVTEIIANDLQAKQKVNRILIFFKLK